MPSARAAALMRWIQAGGTRPCDPCGRVGIRHRVERLLLGLAVQPGALAAVPARPLKHNPALLVGVDRPLHACHLFDSLTSDRVTCQQLLHVLGVGGCKASHRAARRRVSCSACAPGGAARFARRRMIFPVAVEAEPLLRAAVCLHLRHVAASLVPGVLAARVLSCVRRQWGSGGHVLRSPGG